MILVVGDRAIRQARTLERRSDGKTVVPTGPNREVEVRPARPLGMADSADGADDAGFFTRDKLLLLAVVVSGIVLPGIARRFLGEAGYPGVGTIVFVLGYAGMVFLVWYGWIRPLELTGPVDR